jgi:hypothetical protein
MAIGVAYEDFWHGEPEIVRYAIEVYEVRQKVEAIQADAMAWNTGRYVMLGVGVVLSQAFSRNSQVKYPTEPVLAYELDERLKEQKRERELELAHANFLAVAASLEARKQNGGVG